MVNFSTIINVSVAYAHASSPKTIFDSGTEAHLFPNRDDFTSFKLFMGKNVCVANSSTLEIKGIRDVIISVKDTEITFQNALYVSELSANLISTEVLNKQGYSHRDIPYESGNYFKLMSPYDGSVFYVILSSSSVYLLSNCPPKDSLELFNGLLIFTCIMAFIMTSSQPLKPQSITVSTEVDLNNSSVRAFQHSDVENLLNLKDPNDNIFILSSLSANTKMVFKT
ncbi:hypothetical protein FQN50_009615 [Emmonsiellopsis sp. PD_5]|nr:hypothetical protein FQN50_009615 [Emmonsiellopsis sp. PD_5]